MLFDFNEFARITEKVYSGGPYSLEEVLSVFRYFFEKYEEFAKEPHPPIRAGQIARICEAMPYIDRTHGSMADIEADTYPDIIDQYFKTPLRNCDYRINHFFSGKVRALRMYEAGLY